MGVGDGGETSEGGVATGEREGGGGRVEGGGDMETVEAGATEGKRVTEKCAEMSGEVEMGEREGGAMETGEVEEKDNSTSVSSQCSDIVGQEIRVDRTSGE